MTSKLINFDDLSIAGEIVPFLRLRLRMLKQRIFRPKIDRGENILIVMPCIIGDCLSYLPAVQAFADQTGASFDVVVSPDFRSLAERLKGVRRVFVAGSSYNRATEQGRRTTQDLPLEYDLMVVLRLSWEAFGLIKHIRCRRIISSDATLLKYMVHLGKSSVLKQPIIQSREVMFKVFGVSSVLRTDAWYTLFDTDGDRRDVRSYVPAMQSQQRKVLIHTGQGWKVKQWNDDKWVDLLERIHSLGTFRFLFVGRGDEEKGTFERIRRRLDFEVYSLINSIDLCELYLIMRRCDFFIGIDSGPRNLAHYANLRSITLLNPAAVKNFMPIDDRDIVVENPNRFPANIVNTRRGASVTLIGVEEVFEAFKKLATRPLAHSAS